MDGQTPDRCFSLSSMHTGDTTTNFPDPTISKRLSKLQRFLGEVAFANFVSRKREGQTEIQTKNQHFFLLPAACKVRTWHAIQDLKHVLAPPKRFVNRCLVSSQGGVKTWQ